MNLLLIYFAFPIAVIIISIILQKLLRNPGLVAAFVFAVFLIVTFAAFDETFLIATLAYTILSFVTAFLVSQFCNSNNNTCDDDDDDDCTSLNNDDILGLNNNSTCGCGCNRNRNYRRF